MSQQPFDPRVVEQNNNRAAHLNNQRNILIGKAQSAQDQFNKSVQAYALKYGVTLDDKNLEQEYAEVTAELERAYKKQSEAITYIESGQYKVDAQKEMDEAKRAMLQSMAQAAPAVSVLDAPVSAAPSVASDNPSVGVQSQSAPASPFSTPVASVGTQGGVESTNPLSAPVVDNPSVETPTAGASTAVKKENAFPAHFAPDSDFGQFGGIPGFGADAVVPGKKDDEDVSEKPFTPEGWGNVSDSSVTPNSVANNMDKKFGDILGDD